MPEGFDGCIGGGEWQATTSKDANACNGVPDNVTHVNCDHTLY